MADVLIAGGGIAGSTMAILLGRTGRKVELFERARFPRDKACGEGLMPSGVGVLDRLGLRHRTGGAPFIGIRYYYGSRVAEGEFPEAERGLGQRRMVLDNAMFAEAVRTPGVAAHTGVRVERPIVSKGRVIGLMVDGEPRYAKLVVAADGVRSGIRRALGLDLIPKRRRVGIRAHFQLPEGREQPPWVEVFTFAGGELYVTPLPGPASPACCTGGREEPGSAGQGDFRSVVASATCPGKTARRRAAGESVERCVANERQGTSRGFPRSRLAGRCRRLYRSCHRRGHGAGCDEC